MTLKDIDKRRAFVPGEVERYWLSKLSWVDLKKRLDTRERAQVLGAMRPLPDGTFEINATSAAIDLFAPWVKLWGGPAFCPHNGQEGHECDADCRGIPVTEQSIGTLDTEVSDAIIEELTRRGVYEGLFMGKANARSANGSTTPSSEVTESSLMKPLALHSSLAGKASRRKR